MNNNNNTKKMKRYLKIFNRILPLNTKYHHNYEGNINSTTHIKTNLLSQSLCIPVKDEKLLLGT